MYKILLAQTDTTVGFLSQSPQRLQEIKKRDDTKPFLKVYASFKTLSRDIRIPSIHKHLVRYSRKTTFIVKNQAFRYVDDPEHSRLIERYGWLYSTSANETGKEYDAIFCQSFSDLVVEDHRGLSEKSASKIFRLTQTRLKQLR
jgi:tRNA A37 threonylcarbamoyladenosine synthetase subunit TsaC/SUA5/YrdC